jgi:Rad4 transglutaminase-like domain
MRRGTGTVQANRNSGRRGPGLLYLSTTCADQQRRSCSLWCFLKPFAGVVSVSVPGMGRFWAEVLCQTGSELRCATWGGRRKTSGIAGYMGLGRCSTRCSQIVIQSIPAALPPQSPLQSLNPHNPPPPPPTLFSRWMHVDPVTGWIDGAADVRQLQGLNRTLAYVVGFAGGGAKDLTRRYAIRSREEVLGNCTNGREGTNNNRFTFICRN